ncbi:hypothetical protein CK3_07240 [butyrate-producing bacterium SS3/4]|nr:hypothetical protein CK3_07240 [butyrate-producing bacterium SS3/4]
MPKQQLTLLIIALAVLGIIIY